MDQVLATTFVLQPSKLGCADMECMLNRVGFSHAQASLAMLLQLRDDMVHAVTIA